MIVVQAGDYIGLLLYLFGSIQHGYAGAGGCQHGNIVIGISCGVGVGEGNVKIIAQKTYRVAFTGIPVKEFQIHMVGVNGADFVLSPVGDAAAKGFQFVKVVQTDSQHLKGALGERVPEIGGDEQGQMDFPAVIGNLCILCGRNDSIRCVGLDVQAIVVCLCLQIGYIGKGKSFFPDAAGTVTVINLRSVTAGQKDTGLCEPGVFFYFQNT